MDKPGCEWVRSRLPLYAGVGDGLGDPGDDGGDLDVADRRAIGRHLAACADCRVRGADLDGAMGALAAIAGAPPAASSDAGSLWPALERRIAAGAGVDPARGRPLGAAAGRGPDWSALDDERPLQSAWLHDTLREAAEAVGLGVRPGGSRVAGRDRSGTWRVAGVSLAASILLLVVVLPVTWRLRSGAEARMLANTTPVPPMVGPPAPTEAELVDAAAPAPPDRRGIESRELAQVEVIRRPSEPSPAAEAAAGGKSGSSRFGDLEHVTPMPPDGRDAKSVY